MNIPKPSEINVAPRGQLLALNADLSDTELERLAGNSSNPEERMIAEERLSARRMGRSNVS